MHHAAFRLFDRMMLLLRGRVVYFGPRGSEAVEYFKAAPLPEGQMMTSLAEGANEAEWIVDITTQADRQQRCILLMLHASPSSNRGVVTASASQGAALRKDSLVNV